jgi:hypothetical protein
MEYSHIIILGHNLFADHPSDFVGNLFANAFYHLQFLTACGNDPLHTAERVQKSNGPFISDPW